MPRDAIRIDFSALTKFTERVEKDLNDASQAMVLIAEVLQTGVEETFIQQGGVPGQLKWDELGEKTKEARRGSEPYQILTDTAVMRNSMAPRFGNDWAEVFSDNPYLPPHRSGMFLPLRDPFAIDEDELQAEATEMMFQYFRRGRRG